MHINSQEVKVSKEHVYHFNKQVKSIVSLVQHKYVCEDKGNQNDGIITQQASLI